MFDSRRRKTYSWLIVTFCHDEDGDRLPVDAPWSGVIWALGLLHWADMTARIVWELRSIT